MDTPITSPIPVQEPETPVKLIPTEEPSDVRPKKAVKALFQNGGSRAALTQDGKAAILKTLELLILSITDLICLHGPLSNEVAGKLETLYSMVWK